jgi:hypothetical protein
MRKSIRRAVRSRKLLLLLWFAVSLAIPIGLYLAPITPELRAVAFVVSAIAAGVVSHRVDVRSRLRRLG